MGRFAAGAESAETSKASIPLITLPNDVQVGARCLVSGDGDRRGTIRYAGESEIGKGGTWVGVELDEPVGKGDGE